MDTYVTSNLKSLKKAVVLLSSNWKIGCTGWVASTGSSSYYVKPDIGYWSYGDDSQMKDLKRWTANANSRLNINEDVVF